MSMMTQKQLEGQPSFAQEPFSVVFSTVVSWWVLLVLGPVGFWRPGIRCLKLLFWPIYVQERREMGQAALETALNGI